VETAVTREHLLAQEDFDLSQLRFASLALWDTNIVLSAVFFGVACLRLGRMTSVDDKAGDESAITDLETLRRAMKVPDAESGPAEERK